MTFIQGKVKELAGSHKDLFLKLAFETVLARINKEIPQILTMGWAKEISDKDLFHVHVCIPWVIDLPNFSGDEELIKWLVDNAVLLYHSQEWTGIYTDRNIISKKNPDTIYTDNSRKTINPNHLQAYAVISLYFKKGISGRIEITKAIVND
ncbi:MAG TPA: hypothetical protein VI612_00835 [Candidatus Nanoarchaeia archaeon]|nr:hypothetical protein [Candidatus Nanoarchaeia archaeon]